MPRLAAHGTRRQPIVDKARQVYDAMLELLPAVPNTLSSLPDASSEATVCASGFSVSISLHPFPLPVRDLPTPFGGPLTALSLPCSTPSLDPTLSRNSLLEIGMGRFMSPVRVLLRYFLCL